VFHLHGEGFPSLKKGVLIMMRSLCDTDFYKLTMMQVVLHQYAGAWVRYAFKWRNWDQMHLQYSLGDFKNKIDKKIARLCELRFHHDELEYLSNIPFFKADFIEYLRLFQLNKNYVNTYIENDELKINIEGPWLNTILFEIRVLAIISKLYTEMNGFPEAKWQQEGRRRLHDKVDYLGNVITPDQSFRFGNFGTWRRAS
jgi:nicotinate phosphoribosyltransferase